MNERVDFSEFITNSLFILQRYLLESLGLRLQSPLAQSMVRDKPVSRTSTTTEMRSSSHVQGNVDQENPHRTGRALRIPTPDATGAVSRNGPTSFRGRHTDPALSRSSCSHRNHDGLGGPSSTSACLLGLVTEHSPSTLHGQYYLLRTHLPLPLDQHRLESHF